MHKNWFTSIEILFLIVAFVVLVRQIIIWGPEFVLDFLINSEITNEKVSAFMIIFSFFMMLLGAKHKKN